MGLPFPARAAALVAALSTTSAIIVTISEIGHPPPDGAGMWAFLQAPMPPAAVGVASIQSQSQSQSHQVPVSAEMPQP